MNKICNSKASMMLIGLVLTLSIFAMGVLGNEGLGWFASNDRVTADDMGISVTGEFDVINMVEYFAIESISLDDTKNIYTFNNTPLGEGEKNLGLFSTLVAERQILIKITLNDNVGAVRVSATSSADGYIADETPNISKEHNSLSSVVEFYSVPADAVDTSGDKYVISSEAFEDNSSRFADVEVDGNRADISFTPYISVCETSGDNVIYIIVDYYEAAAEHIMDTVSMLELNGEITFDENDEEHIITFAPDFTITVGKIA